MMTTEEAQKHAASIHKLAAELNTSFCAKRELHPPLSVLLPMFAKQMTQLLTGKLPTSALEAAKLLYLSTCIGAYTVDEIAAAYAAITNTHTVAE